MLANIHTFPICHQIILALYTFSNMARMLLPGSVSLYVMDSAGWYTLRVAVVLGSSHRLHQVLK